MAKYGERMGDEIKENWLRKSLGFRQKEWGRKEVQVDREKTDEKGEVCRVTLLPGETGG